MAQKKRKKKSSKKISMKVAKGTSTARGTAGVDSVGPGDPALASEGEESSGEVTSDVAASSGDESKPGLSVSGVTLAHIFELRPRVSTSFRQEHFRNAKQRLKSENYESMEKAARAVAEKALEMTNEGAQSGLGRKGRRRSG